MNMYFCTCCDSEFCSTLNIHELLLLFGNLSLNHADDTVMAAQFPYHAAGTQVRKSFRISEIEFANSPHFHHVIQALIVPNYFQFVLPTLQKDRQLPMEPLNWEFGIRCNRPFEGVSSYQQNQALSQAPRYKQTFCSGAVCIGDAFGNQPDFWEAGPPIFDPYNHQIEQSAAGPLKIKFGLLSIFLEEFVKSVLVFVMALWEGMRLVVPLLLRVWKRLVGRITWKQVISMIMAWQLVKFLPGMEGTVTNTRDGIFGNVAPLYVVMIPSYKLRKFVALCPG